jgi:hypothetical protein
MKQILVNNYGGVEILARLFLKWECKELHTETTNKIRKMNGTR